MASPPAAGTQSEKPNAPPVPRTPLTGPRTPVGVRLLQLQGSPAASDEAMWRRLREAGFDEDMIRRRDKAALVAYITKLESELYEYQHHMGLLILERTEWLSKYDEVKANADLADINHMRELAAKITALSEAQRREENLKKALLVKKECVINLEKALHEIRAESAETKVAAETKLAEANSLKISAHKKLDEAESKMRAAESMHTEANLYNGSASRKLQEVEAREDDLRRRMALLNSEWDAKDKDICHLRESVGDTQKILQKERDKLLEQQCSLNLREEHIFERSKELDNLENELRNKREKVDRDLASIKEKESSFSMNFSLLAEKEQAIISREAQLDKRQREMIVLQESLVVKEKDEIQRLRTENEFVLQKLKFNMEAELAAKHKLLEDELDAKQHDIDLKEIDIVQRERVLEEKEKSLELQIKTLADKEADIEKSLELLSEKENQISASEKMAADSMLSLENEKTDIMKMKKELEDAKHHFQDEKNQLILAHQRLEITAIERSDLFLLETELKEEIDSFRAQKAELAAEIERIREEKEKFEAEWELIDEKKEEIRREAELVEQEKASVVQYLKNEHDCLKLEKKLLLDQFKRDSDLLTHERAEFMRNMEQERSELFSQIQRERDNFLEDIKIQKKELEININKRRTELETDMREKEEAFENEKKQELDKILFQKERVEKDLEKLELEREKIKKEHEEMVTARQLRDREWSEMNGYVNELELQREKLQKARESLELERYEIYEKIKQLRELEKKNLAEVKAHALDFSRQNVVEKSSNWKNSLSGSANVTEENVTDRSQKSTTSNKGYNLTSTPSFSWFKKYTDTLFWRSPELRIASIKNSSPERASGSGLFLGVGLNDKKLKMARSTDDLKETLKGNIEEQISKSVAEKFHATKTLLSKEVSSLGDGSDESLKFNERLCKENAMVNGSSIQDMECSKLEASGVVANATPLTRKRLKDSSVDVDPGMYSDSLKKYQKRRRQGEAPQSPIEDTPSNSIGLEEVPRTSVSSHILGQDSGTGEPGLNVNHTREDVSENPGISNLIGRSVDESETEVDGNICHVEIVETLGDCVLNTNPTILSSNLRTAESTYTGEGCS